MMKPFPRSVRILSLSLITFMCSLLLPSRRLQGFILERVFVTGLAGVACSRLTPMARINERCVNIGSVRTKAFQFHKKVKVCFYIAQYPVHWTAQRALHFTPFIPAPPPSFPHHPVHSRTTPFIPAPTRLLWEAF